MARKKSTKKTPIEFFLDCSCGAKAQIFSLGEKGFMSHCIGCGAMTFFHDPVLLERLRLGGQLCPHHPERKPCPGGHTSWCPICRVRTFYYNSGGEE